MIDQTCTSHKQLTRIIAVHSLYVIVISTVFPDANIYNMMRLFWKINEYTKPMALMYNCWHTRNKRRQNILTEYDVNKCMDRQTLSSTQMLRVIFSSKSAETKKRFVNSAS